MQFALLKMFASLGGKQAEDDNPHGRHAPPRCAPARAPAAAEAPGRPPHVPTRA